MAGLGLSMFGDLYRGRRVLVTGHTGFKGSWLAKWLTVLGADVSGIGLDPDTDPNHWDLLNIESIDHRQDIRDVGAIQALVRELRPDVVFHLAAQPLVRRSYREPLETWSTNVMGTAHVLEACRQVDSVKVIVAVTTDKVYANQEWRRGYRETDALGGHDPYSASKGACELLISSYRNAYFQAGTSPLLASVRAGNVIGGGDWSEDRLIPDLVRALGRRERLVIRSPDAVRPWQHVLDCLSGYLLLGQKLLEGHRDLAAPWNFGPAPDDNRTVSSVLAGLRTDWPELAWDPATSPQAHETTVLHLDSTQARSVLDWQPVWSLDQALRATAEWYREYLSHGVAVSARQLADYVQSARSEGVVWAS